MKKAGWYVVEEGCRNKRRELPDFIGVVSYHKFARKQDECREFLYNLLLRL